MTYLLDTNACIEHLRSRGRSVISQRLLTQRAGEVVVCSIVEAELWAGVYRARDRQREQEAVQDFLAVLPSMPFDSVAAERYGHIHAYLATRGTPINAPDLLIGAIAIASNLTVVTHNSSDFAKIPGLRWEDWQSQ